MEEQDLRFFIEVQWALFENDSSLLEILTREIRRRGGLYIPFTGLKSANSPKTPTRPARKRKPVIQRKRAHKGFTICSKRPATRKRSDLSSTRVPKKAAPLRVVEEDIDGRQSSRIAGLAEREKDQELQTKPLMASDPMPRGHKKGLPPTRSRSGPGATERYRVKRDGVIHSKRRDQLKNNRRKKSPPQLMEGDATCSSTLEGNGKIAQESCETMRTSLGDCCAVSCRQETHSLPLPHLGNSISPDDSSLGPVSLEPCLCVSPPLPAVQGPGEVKQLVSSEPPLLPAENAIPESFGEVEDPLSTDVGVDNTLTDPRDAPPTNHFPIVKPPIPAYPPIWAQVIFTHILVYIYICSMLT
jgi:hypothetical protein